MPFPPSTPARRLALLVLSLAMACRRGDIAGSGAHCLADDDCRSGYRCDTRRLACEPASGAAPASIGDASDAPAPGAAEGTPPDASEAPHEARDQVDEARDLAGEGSELGWTPTALAGLVLWLDAATGLTRDVQGGVTRWTDLSGRGNDAHQDVPAMRPTLSSDDHGHPVLVFRPGGVLLRVTDNELLQWGTGDWSMFIVASTVNTLDNPALFMHKQDPYFPYVGWLFETNQSNAGEMGVGRLCGQLRYLDVRLCSAEGGHDDGALVLFGLQRTDREWLAVRVNGRASAKGLVPVLDVSAAGSDLFIGGHGSQPTFQLQGTIAEIVAVRGPLSDADRDALEHHLVDKYGLH
jgi:hypothetical protein